MLNYNVYTIDETKDFKNYKKLAEKLKNTSFFMQLKTINYVETYLRGIVLKRSILFFVVAAALGTMVACVFQKENLKLEIEDSVQFLPEKNLYYSIKNLYSTHCYDSLTLYWTNPESPKFCKSRIIWDNNEIELYGEPSEEMTLEIKDIIPGVLTNFTVEAYDTKDLLIDSLEIETYAGHCYYEGENILYYGRNLNNYLVKPENILGIAEYKLIPEKLTVTVQMEDLCINENADKTNFGLFKSVSLEPFAIAEKKLTDFPVSLNEAIKLCNELTCSLMSEENCVYYADSDCTVLYTDCENEEFYVNEYCKGFRLPSSAEWEFALRGGNPNSKNWGKELYFSEKDISGEFTLDFKPADYSEKITIKPENENYNIGINSFSKNNGIDIETFDGERKADLRVVRSL